MTDSQRAYDAYAQGHKDACQDTDCVLRPDSTYPSYGQGWAEWVRRRQQLRRV